MGRLTFDVGEHYDEFGLFKDQDASPSSFACCGCDMALSNEIVESFDVCLNAPHKLNYVSIEDLSLDCAKVDLAANLPPIVAKDKHYAFNEVI